MSKKKILDISSVTLVVLSFIITVYFWNILPDTVPTHWNIDGYVDAWGPKWITLLLFPAINLLVYTFMSVFPKIDPFKNNYNVFNEEYLAAKLLIIALFFTVYISILIATLYPSFSVVQVALPVIFSIFSVSLGCLLPKFKPNWFLGIRTPWTLSSEKSWIETHKLAGKLFIISGIITLASLLFFKTLIVFFVFISSMLLAALLPIIYSYFVWKKYNTKEEN